ncbi:MAG: hypothetical protein NTW58_05795 [Actinobacteria bacterium]|nr:hypothetical protein [Actinomycetota bacterium]
MSEVGHGRPAPTVWVALAALLLALAAGSWLAFSPGSYQVVSVTASSSGEVVQRSEQTSLLAENGMWALGLLAIPVVLTGLGVFGAVRSHRFLLWSVAVVLLVFSVISGMTIGLFYLPAAITLLVAAALCNSSRTPRRA